MKFVKILILVVVCLVIGAAGGFVEGFSYGKKSAAADKDFATIGHGEVVPLNVPAAPTAQTPAPAAPVAAPAPAPAAAPAAPAPAAVPAAPAKPADGWNTIGTKTMSQQAVIDLPADEKPAAAAPAAAPATAAVPALPAPAPAAASAPAAAPAAGATTYAISADDSTLDFTGYKEVAGEKVGMSGMFGGFSGSVNVPGDNLEQMSFDVTVNTATINTENAILTSVLKTGMFFDVAAFPEAKLVSQSVVKEGDKYVATVAWTMRDKTIGFKLPLAITKSGNSITATCETFIDRNNWGVGPAVYENKELGISMPILPDVKVKFEMVANKK